MRRMTLSDFSYCIGAAWIINDVSSVRTAVDFHEYFERAFEEKKADLERLVRLDFIIRTHQLHGDSENIASIFAHLHSSRLGYYRSTDGSVFYFDWSKESAQQMFDQIAPDKELQKIFKQIALNSLKKYHAKKLDLEE